MTPRLPWILVLLASILPAQEAHPESIYQNARKECSSGLYSSCAASLEQAWTLCESGGDCGRRQYDIAKLQARASAAAGKPEEAESYLQRAINWRETKESATGVVLAEDLTELAMLCRARKDLERGLAIMRRVISAYHAEGSGGKIQAAPLADAYHRLGILLSENDEPEPAASSLRSALHFREEHTGGDHPSLLGDLDRLGAILTGLRSYGDAEAVYRRALVIREQTVGPAENDLIQPLDGLAYALFGQKKFAEAEPVYKRLLQLWAAFTGRDHPMVAFTLDKLAVFYRAQDRKEEGDTAAGESIAIRSLFLSTGLAREAGVQLAGGDRTKAEQLYRRALETLDAGRPEHEELIKDLKARMKNFRPAKRGKSAR